MKIYGVKSQKVSVILFLSIAILIAIVNICCAQRKNTFSGKENEAINKNETTIILWNHGKKILLNQYLFAKEIQEKCESIFEDANDMYRLSVGEGLIKKLRKKEISIEIIYNSPKEFFPFYWKNRLKPKKLQILRLLIPLTGRFSLPPTIFYGTPEDKLPDGTTLEYGAFNDLINNHAEEEINYIKEILKTNLSIKF